VVVDVARLGCRNWTIVALNREGWRKFLKEAEAHPQLSRRWRERERVRKRERGLIYCFTHTVIFICCTLGCGQYPFKEFKSAFPIYNTIFLFLKSK
jgi:hypothetical protein